MTDEQRRRVHEITYSTQDREELAERIVRLEDERDLYSSLVEDMDHPDTANQLRVENAKLRELAQDYDRALASTHALCDSDFATLIDATLLVLRSMMHKFGIEVEE